MAQDMGLPVVIKPSDGNHGRGVALDLNSQNEIEAAWRVADAEGSQVMVERFVRGEEHRLLVVGDQVVAAARGELACITGDGVTTVALLIEQQLNTDPRRGEEEHFPLDTIRLDEQPHAVLELQRQGLSADSIPALGRRVIVQRNGNMSNDVTDLIHPEVAELATLAARVIGLDIAGIDLVAQDISRPLHEQGAAVVEVNAGPSLLMHLKPASGQARPVGQAIANHLFPPKDNGRIPIVGIVGHRHTASLAQLVAWLLHLSGSRVGMACSLGVFMDQRHVDTQDARGFEMGERLLINRNIDAAVFETSPREILLEGLPYDRCHVGLVADMPAFEGLQDLDVTSADNMRQVVRTQVDVVLREGVAVLNADVSAVAELEDLCDGEVMMYGLNPDSAILGAHRRQGRRSVFCRQGHVTLARGDQETTLLHLDLAPVARLLKHEDMSVSHLLAAVACAWSLGVTPTLMRAGLKNFRQKTESESQEKARMKA
jgi:cyanophycin synthetase